MLLLGDQLIDILGSSDNTFANEAIGTDNHGKNQPTTRNPCGIRHMVITSHKWDECHSNPKNANKPEAKKYLAKTQLASDKKNKGFTNSTTEIAKLKAQVAAQQALLEVKANKGNSHQNDKATLAEIMQYDNLDEKEAALEELVLSLHALSVNGGANVTNCYTIADAQATSLQQPIIDSGASMTFVTISEDLNENQHSKRTNMFYKRYGEIQGN